MGVVSSPPLDSLDLKSIIQGNEEKCQLSGSLWDKVMEAQSKRRRRLRGKSYVTRKNGGQVMRCRKTRIILQKKRTRVEGSRSPANTVERKVKILKMLIPNSESTGLDGLFRKTSDYILALQ